MDEVEEIKQRLDIVDFISQYLTLKKAGVNYKAVCPFHQEKTPSFMVSADKQIFKCFGCDKGGDIITFLMEMENLNFREALETLADKAGIILNKSKNQEEYQKEKNDKSRLYKINQWAAAVYHKILLEHQSAQRARDYLQKRKIDLKTIREFKLGYAPPKNVLVGFLAKKRFNQLDIRQAGSPDRFKDRIIFPIFDQIGNVVGFTGRVLDPKNEPKYLNTPETKAFYKSRILYALEKAKKAIKEKKTVILVEGQTDVVLSHQVGVKNVVASSGTALTPQHLDILSRYVPNIAFAFDNDLAGSLAARKAIQMAIEAGLNARMIEIPSKFKDVGEVVEENPQLWQKIAEKSVLALDWLFDQSFLNRELNSVSKKEIAQELLPFIKIIPDKIEQSHYIKLLAKRLEVKETTIIEVLDRIKSAGKNRSLPGLKDTKNISPEDNLIGLLITYPQFIPWVVKELDYSDFINALPSQQIYKFLESCYTKSACSLGEKVCQEQQKLIKCFENQLSLELSKKVKFLVLYIQTKYSKGGEEEIKSDIQASLLRIKQNKRENIKKDFAARIQQAEAEKNIGKVKELLKDLQHAISEKK